MKDDRIYLQHILECIRRIEVNTAVGEAEFLHSHTLQDAVLRNLQTWAESTQRLSHTTNSSMHCRKFTLLHTHLRVEHESYVGTFPTLSGGIQKPMRTRLTVN